ncbi:MAG TPA: sigma-70 family RNA polymerase sigma factor [Fimbriiglobus sp.]|jgi:RNA polymerase sigma factor (TIGR02999 family)
MSDVTRLLEAAQAGDEQAANRLLPLVYDELRKLAAAKMAAESSGHTLDATGLVHEAYLRLVGNQQFEGCGHFYAAAAEAMRRILIDMARHKSRQKRGGSLQRVDLDSGDLVTLAGPDEMLIIDEAIQKLVTEDPVAGRLVQLRYFAGLSVEEAGELAGLSRSTAYEHWAFARAWLYRALHGTAEGP